jgi:hypothetical protein
MHGNNNFSTIHLNRAFRRTQASHSLLKRCDKKMHVLQAEAINCERNALSVRLCLMRRQWPLLSRWQTLTNSPAGWLAARLIPFCVCNYSLQTTLFDEDCLSWTNAKRTTLADFTFVFAYQAGASNFA